MMTRNMDPGPGFWHLQAFLIENLGVRDLKSFAYIIEHVKTYHIEILLKLILKNILVYLYLVVCLFVLQCEPFVPSLLCHSMLQTWLILVRKATSPVLTTCSQIISYVTVLGWTNGFHWKVREAFLEKNVAQIWVFSKRGGGPGRTKSFEALFVCPEAIKSKQMPMCQKAKNS